MKALIDGDIFCYSHGSAKDDEGHPLAWPLVASRISSQISNIVDATNSDSYQIYLTGTGNFRVNAATIKPYKGTRPTEKPYHHKRVFDFLVKFRNAEVISGCEADDKLSTELYQGLEWDSTGTLQKGSKSVLCSLDKDLNNTPGWHYNWTKDEVYWVDEITALRSFYKQLLTGDTVDNILCLYGVGKSSALLTHVNNASTELEMYCLVREQYEKRFGSYWWKFILENGRLLWMLREPYDKPAYVVKNNTGQEIDDYDEFTRRLICLEEKRLVSLEVN